MKTGNAIKKLGYLYTMGNNNIRSNFEFTGATQAWFVVWVTR